MTSSVTNDPDEIAQHVAAMARSQGERLFMAERYAEAFNMPFERLEGAVALIGRHCRIEVEARPGYCDRGAFKCHVVLNPDTHPRDLDVDEADGWPRYYFLPSSMILECREWLRARHQVV